MKPKVIKNEREHKAALARIDELMDARSGTPEVSELELLATLVEAYEEKRFPIKPLRPDHHCVRTSRSSSASM